MKKLLTLCAFAAGLLMMAVSCNLKDVFTINNLDDIVTVEGEYLISDLGTCYHVTEDLTESKDWQKDGNRLYVLVDVMNRDLDITLKQAHPIEIREPEPLAFSEDTTMDPVVVGLQNISGNYINLVLQIYKEKGTECPHHITFQYRKSPGGDGVELFVFHDGNNENPTRIAEEDLKTEVRFYSIPLESLTSSRSAQITIVMDTLAKDSEGHFSIQRSSFKAVRGSSSYYN